jgi:hypothetical protein
LAGSPICFSFLPSPDLGPDGLTRLDNDFDDRDRGEALPF